MSILSKDLQKKKRCFFQLSQAAAPAVAESDQLQLVPAEDDDVHVHVDDVDGHAVSAVPRKDGPQLAPAVS